jgi:MFS family permease
MRTISELQHGTARLRRTGPSWGVLLLSSTLLTFLVASSAPSSVYHLYQAQWHLSSGMITVVYGVYCLSVLAALLTIGSVSDHIGRRPVILTALGIEALSMAVFCRADGVTALLIARLLQGLATGMATSTLGAALLDISHKRATVVLISAGPLVGMAVGTLGTSLLVEFLPAPTRTVYLLLLAALLAQTLATLFLPETGVRKPGALASIRQGPRVPRPVRRTLLLIAPVFVAVWALGGFYLALGTRLAQNVTGSESVIVGGLTVFALAFTGILPMLVIRRMAPADLMRAGALVLAVGMAVVLVGVHLRSSTLFFAGDVLAGAGFGPAFQGGVGAVVRIATAEERARLMASIYVITYLAMCVPVVAAGFLCERYGLIPTATWFGICLIALTLSALVASWDRLGRRAQ